LKRRLFILGISVVLLFLSCTAEVNATEKEWVKIREYNDDSVCIYDLSYPRFDVEGDKLKLIITAYAEQPSICSVDIGLYNSRREEIWNIRIDDDLSDKAIWPSDGMFNKSYILDEFEPGEYYFKVGGANTDWWIISVFDYKVPSEEDVFDEESVSFEITNVSTVHKPPEEFYEKYPSLWEYYPCFVLKNTGTIDIYISRDNIYVNHTCAPYPYAYIKYGSDSTSGDDYDFDISYYSSGSITDRNIYIKPGEKKKITIDGKYDYLSFWDDHYNRYLEISIQDAKGNVFTSKGQNFPAVSSYYYQDGTTSDYGGDVGASIDFSGLICCLTWLFFLIILPTIIALFINKKKKEQKRIAKEMAEKIRAEQEKNKEETTKRLKAEKEVVCDKKKKIKGKPAAWDVIIKFAEKKYRGYWPLEECYRLNDLLRTKYNLNIDHDILLLILNDALNEVNEKERLREYNHFKKTLLLEKPESKVDYIDALLKHYGEDSLNNKNIRFLNKLLEEKGIDGSELVALIKERKKRLELDIFEKTLIKEEVKEEVNLDFMSGYEFEQFLGNLFKKMGYNVINTKLSGDQGADLIVERFGEKTVVQAKNYSGSVGNKAVQEALAAREYYKCDKAIVITTSYFTRQAIDAAKKTKVELWDRNKLNEIITRYSGTDTHHKNEEDIEIDDRITTVCKICGVNETDNPDGICDDCKAAIVLDRDVPPNEEDFL